jgi:hypothetical protein
MKSTRLTSTNTLLQLAAWLSALACGPGLLASENAPRRPFAQWASLPAPGQLIAGVTYEESEAYYVWAGNRRTDITWKAGGESYGIDVTQGYLTLDYGIAEKWAADLNLGGTTVGWRSFDPAGAVRSTIGLMDYALGVRYQIFKEGGQDCPWTPTLTFRAGGVLPGNYSKTIAFAPGNRSAAIEPSLLARKHFGWPGFGAYTDLLFRWMRTTGADQFIGAVGLFQEIKGWELNAGYRHLQSISGDDLTLSAPPAPFAITYPRAVRENSDAIEAGFSYTTSKWRIRYGFHSRTIFDGSNTDKKFWLGASIDVPFDVFDK